MATIVLLYNSQAQAAQAVPVLVPVGLPAGVASYDVYGPNAAAVPAQLMPLSGADNDLRTYYSAPATPATNWLAFQATLPPVGYAVYFIVPSATPAGKSGLTTASVVTTVAVGEGAGDEPLTNGIVTLTFDGTTGRLKLWADASSGLSVPVAHDTQYYRGAQGTRDDGQGASGRGVTGSGARAGRACVCGSLLACARYLTREC